MKTLLRLPEVAGLIYDFFKMRRWAVLFFKMKVLERASGFFSIQ